MLTLKKVITGELVFKANELIEAGYKITLQEQRLLAVMISMIHKDHKDFQIYKVDLNELAKIIGYKGRSFYREAVKITAKLESRVISIKDKDKDTLLQTSWISSAEYINQKGLVELSFDPKLKPYLLALKERYTSFALLNILRLRSIYSTRIYELMKQYEKLKKRKFLLEDLRKILGLEENEYRLFGDFKRRILESSIKEINKTTDLFLEYETKKEGRKVVAITFFINLRKEKEEESLPAPEIKDKTLHKKLTNYFGQTVTQATKYLEKYSVGQIKQNLFHVERRYRAGEIENIGAYTHKAISENYSDQKSLFDEDIYKKTEQAKKEKEDAEKAKEQDINYQNFIQEIGINERSKYTKEQLKELEEKIKKEMINNGLNPKFIPKILIERNGNKELAQDAGALTFEEWVDQKEPNFKEWKK